jgi:hypothetical protein
VITDLDRLHFSAGILPMPHMLTARRQAGDPQKIDVSWQDDTGSGAARPDDELMMMIAQRWEFHRAVSHRGNPQIGECGDPASAGKRNDTGDLAVFCIGETKIVFTGSVFCSLRFHESKISEANFKRNEVRRSQLHETKFSEANCDCGTWYT